MNTNSKIKYLRRVENERRYPNWAYGDMVYFVGNEGYGVVPMSYLDQSKRLKTIYLGSSDELTKYFEAGELPELAWSMSVFTLTWIKNYLSTERKVNGEQTDRTIPKRNNQSGTRKVGSKRSRFMLDTRHRPPSTRRIAGTKRIPNRLPQPNLPGVSG